MRKGRLAKLFALCAGGLALGLAGFALAGTTTLAMTSSGPEPETVTVHWGDQLEIENDDNVPHSLVSSHQELQSGVIQPGQTYTTTFTSSAHSYSFRQIGGRGFPGKVVVSFAGHVTLRARPAAVGFGRSVTLRGVSSIPLTPVALEVHRAGDVRWHLLRTVVSRSDGTFSATVRFARGGRLRASIAADQIRSVATAVAVRPKLTIAASGGRVRARVSPAGAAERLTLECRVSAGRWKRLDARGPRHGTVSFRVHAGRPNVLRVAVLHNDAADGFAPQASRAVRLSAGC